MTRKFYTIFILPHAHARFRKIHVSRNFMLTCVSVLALVAVAGALSPHLLLKVRVQSSTLERLQAENVQLRQEKQRYEASLGEIGSQLNAIESVAGRIAGALGMRNLPLPQPAGGAGSSGSMRRGGWVQEELVALQTRTQSLNLSFEQINQAWEQRVKLLASTPSLRPVQGYLGDGYGFRLDPFTGEREFHKGLDIVASHGEPVRATADGVVVAAGRWAGYGRMVHLSHGYGLGSRYGHLSVILVRPGQRVKKGEVVGLVGSTGRSTGSHLHYEVLKGSAQVNPRKYLSEATL